MMNTSAQFSGAPSATFNLLTYYSLERERYPQPLTKIQVLDRWLRVYPEPWVRLALIESLYQGRYKTFSVEQLLALWNRRGQPVYHFNREFESLVCRNIPRQMSELPSKKDSKPFYRISLAPFAAPATAPLLPMTEDIGEVSATEHPEEYAYSEDMFERSRPQASVLESVLANHQLLPLTMSRLGLEPIHQFMPEAEPIEFCEKLEAIARAQLISLQV